MGTAHKNPVSFCIKVALPYTIFEALITINQYIMNRRNTLLSVLSFSVLGLSLLLMGYGGVENGDYPSGSPAGYTGSPGDGKNCTQCHNGSASTVTGWITSNIPASGYTAGSTYTITVTVSGSGAKGFEVSPQNPSGTLLGTLTAGTGSHLTGSGKYVTQNSSVNSNPATWTFTWTAPAVGTGDVTFYGAFTVNKPVTKLSTLLVHEGPPPLGVTASATPSQICTGAQSQLNANPVGGSGSYTYAWTSVPAGFTSTQKDPMVQPLLNTTYTVVVNDGSNNASAQTTVIVSQNASSFAGNDTTVCNNIGSVDLYGNCQNYSTSLWTSNGDGVFANAAVINTSYTLGPNDITNGSVQLTLTANAQSPCSAPASASKVITIIPCSVLTANASATPSSICIGSQSQLNVEVAGGSGTYTYSWTSVPAGFTSTLKDPWVQPTSNTTYYVAVIDGTSVANSQASVNVTPLATANAGEDTICCHDVLSIPLHGFAGNFSSIQWSTGGDGVFTNANALITSYIPGTNDRLAPSFSLMLSANPANPCLNPTVDEKMVSIEICESLNEAEGINNVVVISPNPTQGKVNIAFTAQGNQCELAVYSNAGEQLLSNLYECKPGKNSVALNLENLRPGIYFLVINNYTATVHKKLIIQ